MWSQTHVETGTGRLQLVESTTANLLTRPVSLASLHDLFEIIVFHVVEQDLVEPGNRHRDGNTTSCTWANTNLPHMYVPIYPIMLSSSTKRVSLLSSVLIFYLKVCPPCNLPVVIWMEIRLHYFQFMHVRGLI